MELNATELAAQIADAKLTLEYGLNAAWLINTGIGITLMQAGFMALEAGTVKAKNVKAALFKNLLDHSTGALCWYCFGWSMFVGSNSFASGDDATWFYHPEMEYPRIFQQYGYAVTAATIVSGAVLSRCRLRVYVAFSCCLTLYIYPIVAHWAWTPGGWLFNRGYKDFAGSGVVHLLGGVCGLAGAWACGPRVGRFRQAGDDGSEASKGRDRRGSEDQSEAAFEGTPFRHRLVKKLCCGSSLAYRFVDFITMNGTPGFRVRDQPGHSAPMQCLGALLLYVAWFSFNSGSSGGMETIFRSNGAGRASVNTMLAAAASSVAALLWCDFVVGQYEVDLVVNSLLSGMVAITAGCGYIDPYAAIIVGLLSVPVYIVTAKFVLYGFHIDDPLNVFAVHGANGALGVIWTGLFDEVDGLAHTGRADLLLTQIIGVAAIFAWSYVNSILFFEGLKIIIPRLPCLRSGTDHDEDNFKENPIVYSVDAQLVGLDFFYFGGSGFPDFDVEAVSEYNATQRIKQKFQAKRQGSMRMFGAEPELSVHKFGDVSVHRHVSVSVPLTNVSGSGKGTKNSSQQADGEVQDFSVDNPSRHGARD